ncbi:MAG: universal stress protein [Solirubrobacterales bacterium]|nr:universal stress protein [Solirubrobacterales bacterium]
MIAIVIAAAMAAGAAAAAAALHHRRRTAVVGGPTGTGWPGRRAAAAPAPRPGAHRILFPFVAQALSTRALDVALRLARALDATLVPVFLARVSLDLPLDASIPRQSAIALPLQEAIEQRAAHFGVPVDCRIERGRTHRHALREAITTERYDRLVIAAANRSHPGFSADDVAWLLDHAAGEIVILRPADVEPAEPRPNGVAASLTPTAA